MRLHRIHISDIRTPEHKTPNEVQNEIKAMAKVFGDRSFYVGSTRATHELKIYTSNKQSAMEIVVAKQDKTSAIELKVIEEQLWRGVER